MNKAKITGIALCIIVAIPAWLLGNMFQIIGASIIGILLGLLINHIFKLDKIREGINFTSKKLLKWSIVLLGFNMNFSSILKAGGSSAIIIFSTVCLTLLFGCIINKAIKLDGNTSTLIAVGTSICGGSAIAATAPVIQAEDHEIANSISIIFLFNILAVFIFPPLGLILSMDDTLFGMWAGNAINDTSSVVAAGLTWNGYSGTETALKLATIVKLTRTLMIIPITLVLAFKTTRNKNSEEKNYSIKKIFPWFVIGFLIAAIINSTIDLPFNLSENLSTAGKFLIVVAMVSVGMNIHIRKLIENGIKPIIFGLSCWIFLSISSLILQNIAI